MDSNKNILLSEVLSIIGNTDTADMVDSASSTTETSIITSSNQEEVEEKNLYYEVKCGDKAKVFDTYKEALKHYNSCKNKSDGYTRLYHIEKGKRSLMQVSGKKIADA